MKFDRCPKAWLAEAREELGAYEDHAWLQRFNLPAFAGGKMDQSPRWIEAVGVIEAEIRSLE